ncbi:MULTISPECIES: hypothetical protein [unclassified Streptomyces]|uniref:hypothetical protein n=1 Tax=unclassified Streptomyces TaxID=2593676 RepID=UPI0011B93998|nr:MULTISPECIES: hypothetical protein [unclassified Streptomyces]MYT69750.1 hypothetical protein [Streptomyces sp. SID8367]
MTDNERDRATDAIQHMIQRELHKTVALLVDLGGETADEDDDALVLYGRLPVGPRPDQVQFRTDRLNDVPALLTGAEVTDLGNGLTAVRWSCLPRSEPGGWPRHDQPDADGPSSAASATDCLEGER